MRPLLQPSMKSRYRKWSPAYSFILKGGLAGLVLPGR